MCCGLSGCASILRRSLTMKLSTVRFVGLASRPQIFARISSRETGWPDALVQEAQELDLVERELLALRPALDRVGGQVDLRLADRRRPRARARRARGAAEDGADARDELADAERLGHVVVGAGVEAADLVDLLAARREHDDRHERVAAAQLLADLVAVHVGQHQVEQDRVGLLVLGEGHAVLALARGHDAEALELERVLEPEHDVRLVLDDEDGLLRDHASGRGARLARLLASRRLPLISRPGAKVHRRAVPPEVAGRAALRTADVADRALGRGRGRRARHNRCRVGVAGRTGLYASSWQVMNTRAPGRGSPLGP